MKILLDENIDVRFKTVFPPGVHNVYTVRDMNWNGVRNGALLKLLKENNFDCWVVVDKNINPVTSKFVSSIRRNKRK